MNRNVLALLISLTVFVAATGAAHADVLRGYVCSIEVKPANPSRGDHGALQYSIYSTADCTGYRGSALVMTTNANSYGVVPDALYDRTGLDTLISMTKEVMAMRHEITISRSERMQALSVSFSSR